MQLGKGRRTTGKPNSGSTERLAALAVAAAFIVASPGFDGWSAAAESGASPPADVVPGVALPVSMPAMLGGLTSSALAPGAPMVGAARIPPPEVLASWRYALTEYIDSPAPRIESIA